MKSKSFLFIIVTLFLGVSYLNAASKTHVKLTAEPSVASVKSGEQFLVRFTIKFDKYWHTYGLKEIVNKEGLGPSPTSIKVEPSNLVKLAGKIKTPKPKIEFDEAYEVKIEIFEGNAVFYLPLMASRNLDFSRDVINVVAEMQLCDTTSCLPPDEYKTKVGNKIFEVDESLKSMIMNNGQDQGQSIDQSLDKPTETPVTTAETKRDLSASKPSKGSETYVTDEDKKNEQAKSEGLLSWIWLAMAQGALALLTPCVFPMIPITVSFFTKRAEKKKGRGLVDSTIYALGIILTFTGIGFILALILGPSGIQDFATSPWTNIFIAAIFIVFAFNLFGAFEIQLPTGILNKLNAKSQGNGFGSILLMGLTFSLTSFTCTVPFVGGAFMSTSRGEWFDPIIGMLGFSSVFAAPFFLLALFPSLMNKLPKAGGWMNNIKVVMGFLEIAAAIKFISNMDLAWGLGIMPPELFIAIWIGCGILITLYILGVFKLTHDTPVEKVGSVRIVFALMFVTVTFYLLAGLNGKPLGELDAFIPPPDYKEIINPQNSEDDNSEQPEQPKTTAKPANTVNDVENKSDTVESDNVEIVWMDNYKKAVREAKRTNKPLFIDFSGFQCTNCRWMELNMFPRKNIRELMNQMVLVRLYTDRKTEPYITNKKMQMNKYQTIALPLYVILTPDGKLIGTKAFTRNTEEFRQFLLKAAPVISASN